MPRRSTKPCLSSLAASLAIALSACGGWSAPEEEIRALVDAAETAAEARDASDLKSLVADDYEDGEGRDASEVRTLLHAWLVAHPSSSLLTRIDSIELEGTELARVQITIGVLGRRAGSDAAWDLATDVHRLDVRLARDDDGEWRAIRAAPAS